MNESRNKCGGRRGQKGFTLIELMIVVVVVAILAAIALPTYQNSVRKSQRTVARNTLLDLASREERYFATNNAYAPDLASLGYGVAAGVATLMPVPSAAQTYYNVTLTPATAPAGGFAAQAALTGVQTGDPCGTYTLNSLGVQGVLAGSGTLTAAQCW